MSSECLWGNCEQEVLGSGPFCYFHRKRGLGLITGYISAPGLTTYSEPSANAKALIAALYKEEDK